MRTIQSATNLSELKSTYHYLAKKYHPDCGGNPQTMLRLNMAYHQKKNALENEQRNFSELQLGESIYINGTEAFVILITRTKFVARAKGKSKQAWFDLNTGIGIDFPFYKASFNPRRVSSKSI